MSRNNGKRVGLSPPIGVTRIRGLHRHQWNKADPAWEPWFGSLARGIREVATFLPVGSSFYVDIGAGEKHAWVAGYAIVRGNGDYADDVALEIALVNPTEKFDIARIKRSQLPLMDWQPVLEVALEEGALTPAEHNRGKILLAE